MVRGGRNGVYLIHKVHKTLFGDISVEPSNVDIVF